MSFLFREMAETSVRSFLPDRCSKIFLKFYWEYLCRSLMLVKLTPSLWNLTEQKRWYSFFPANGTLRWVFSCKFTVSFQNTFSEEHLWRAVSECFQEHLLYITPPAMVVKINKKVLENYFFHQVCLKTTFSYFFTIHNLGQNIIWTNSQN